jgi:hypothetical protein
MKHASSIIKRLASIIIMSFVLFCPIVSLAADPILFEDFEDMVLDSRISIETVGSFSSNPGIKAITNFGSTQAFGYGRSTCGASCFNGSVTNFKITFPSPTYVSSIAFKEMELYDNWGSGGKIYVDGISLTPTSNPPPFDSGFSWDVMDFGRSPGNDRQSDTTYRSKTFSVNQYVTVVELNVGDITSASEIFIDDLTVFASIQDKNFGKLNVEVECPENIIVGNPLDIVITQIENRDSVPITTARALVNFTGNTGNSVAGIGIFGPFSRIFDLTVPPGQTITGSWKIRIIDKVPNALAGKVAMATFMFTTSKYDKELGGKSCGVNVLLK